MIGRFCPPCTQMIIFPVLLFDVFSSADHRTQQLLLSLFGIKMSGQILKINIPAVLRSILHSLLRNRLSKGFFICKVDKVSQIPHPLYNRIDILIFLYLILHFEILNRLRVVLFIKNRQTCWLLWYLSVLFEIFLKQVDLCNLLFFLILTGTQTKHNCSHQQKTNQSFFHLLFPSLSNFTFIVANKF